MYVEALKVQHTKNSFETAHDLQIVLPRSQESVRKIPYHSAMWVGLCLRKGIKSQKAGKAKLFKYVLYYSF